MCSGKSPARAKSLQPSDHGAPTDSVVQSGNTYTFSFPQPLPGDVAVQWDPAAEKIIGDEAAQSMADKAYRAPYTHDMKLARS